MLAFLALAVAAASLAAWAITSCGRGAPPEGRKSEQIPKAVFVRAFLAEWLSTTLVLLLWPFGALGQFRGLQRSTAPARGVVLLLPDAGMNGSAFWLLARRLRRVGWRVVSAPSRPWPRRPETVRARLDAEIGRVARQAGEMPVVVLAHGIGGLAARDHLRSADAESVRQLVTLGTPHQGSTGPAYRLLAADLDPGSERMRRLAEDDPVPERVEVIAISSAFDAWIAPPSAAYYPGAFNIEVSAIGHFRLLFSRQVWGLIAENLPAGQGDRR